MRSSLALVLSSSLLGACVCESPPRAHRHHVRVPEPELDPFERAIAAADAHEWTAALAWLDQAEAEHPDRVAIARERVVHARWIERAEPCDFEWLERTIHRRLDEDPSSLVAWAELARLHLDRAVRDEDPSALLQVELILADADRLDGDSAELELVRGLHAQLEGRRDLASAAWKRAAELDPTLAEARLRSGIACLEHRDDACAEAELHAYTRLEPDDPEGWLALGVAYARNDARQLATAAYQHAAELAPDDPRPHWNLASLTEDEAWDWRKSGLVARQNHLANMFAVVRNHPLPDCEAVLDPDPECIARVEARRQLVIEANAEMAELEDALWRPQPSNRIECEARRLHDMEKAAEQERRKKLLEMERAAMGLPPLEPELDIQPQTQPKPEPKPEPIVVEPLGEAAGKPCSIR